MKAFAQKFFQTKIIAFILENPNQIVGSMLEFNSNTGFFLFSLDTELAWGHFDYFPSPDISMDSSQERYVVKRLLEIFDRYGISVTWALVGHMFYSRCEKCPICPIMDWKGKYSVFDQIYETNNSLWYGEDIVDLLLERRFVHEIAFHGYTHRIFDKNDLSEEDARTEIMEWKRLSIRKKLVPLSVIFPRNKVGYLPVFKEAGFICYRGNQLTPRYFSTPLIGKVLKWMDLKFQFCIPEVYQPMEDPSGFVNLPASRRLFGMNPRVSRLLSLLNLSKLEINRIIKGVQKAASEKKVIHIRVHPYEFKSEKNFTQLTILLDAVWKEMKEGKLQSITMSGLAKKVLELNKFL